MNQITVLCVLIFASTLSFAEVESGLGFRQAAVSVLYESLQKGDLNSSSELLEHISQATHLSREETRNQLLSLLDTLEAHRQQKSKAWQELLAGVEKDVGSKRAEQFIKYLTDVSGRCRKMLTVQADYMPQRELEEAAKKAKVTPYEGKDYLLKTLSPLLEKSQVQASPTPLPSKIGLIVDARSNFEEWYPVSPWSSFFATGDDMGPAIQTVRGIAQSVVPFLIQKLPESRFIKWAVEKPTLPLKPDYKLSLEIRSFGIWPASDRGDEYRPVVKAVVILQPVDGMGTVFEESFTVKSQLVHNYQDKKPPDTKVLYEDIAQEAYKVLDTFLLKRSRDQSIH